MGGAVRRRRPPPNQLGPARRLNCAAGRPRACRCTPSPCNNRQKNTATPYPVAPSPSPLRRAAAAPPLQFYLSHYTRGVMTGVRLSPSGLLSSNVTTASGGAVSVSSLRPPPAPRGRWNVSMPPAPAPPPPAPAEVRMNLTVAMPAFAVPQLNSSVACVNLALPNDTAYHVVAYQVRGGGGGGGGCKGRRGGLMGWGRWGCGGRSEQVRK